MFLVFDLFFDMNSFRFDPVLSDGLIFVLFDVTPPQTPLHKALFDGHTETVKYLIANGANINCEVCHTFHFFLFSFFVWFAIGLLMMLISLLFQVYNLICLVCLFLKLRLFFCFVDSLYVPLLPFFAHWYCLRTKTNR